MYTKMLLISLLLRTCSLSAQDMLKPEWTKTVHTADDELIYPIGLETDSEGNLYFAGFSNDTILIDSMVIFTSASADFGFIIKWDSGGEMDWAYKYDDLNNGGYSYLKSIAINSENEIIISGSSSSVCTFNGHYLESDPDKVATSFLHIINNSGETIQYFDIDSANIYEMAVGPSNEITCIGRNWGSSTAFFDSTVTANFFIMQLSHDLQVNYIIDQQGPYTDTWIGNTYPRNFQHIAADDSGNYFVTYIYEDTLHLNGETYLPHNYSYIHIDSFLIEWDSFEYIIDTIDVITSDGLIVKYDSNGNKLWDVVIEGKDGQYFHTLAADENGHLYTIAIFGYNDTIYIQDGNIVILPEDMPGWTAPYTMMHFDADGGLVDYAFSEDSIFLFTEFEIEDNRVYVAGHLYDEVENPRHPLLGRYTTDFTLDQIGRASCPYPFPCYSSGDLRLVEVFDSSIYVFGQYYNDMVMDGIHYGTGVGNNYGYFLSKFPYDFSDPYILPDSLTYHFPESNLYPIPTREQLTISFADETDVVQHITATNTLGQSWPLSAERIDLNNWQANVQHLIKGTYVLTYEADGVMFRSIFIKI